MQNRYTGDIGDYGKLGLLRVLQSCGLKIGVNWYLTPDEKHNDDGCHVGYLENECYRSCDAELWTELKHIVQSQTRKVQALQSDHILKAAYYTDLLDFSGKTKAGRKAFRTQWHKAALKALCGQDVVFLDPDNGLIVPSAVEKTRENKYVLPNEITDYYSQGSSVIYYQHKARKLDSYYSEQFRILMQKAALQGASGLALKFKTTSQRYYFFILQPKHQERIDNAVHSLLMSDWNRHFCK
ncbi:MAG: hypothetical protein IJU28_02620, partial [Clostridia bacterium]|nr:hypothetical protein [Clostridia bacterium]